MESDQRRVNDCMRGENPRMKTRIPKQNKVKSPKAESVLYTYVFDTCI